LVDVHLVCSFCIFTKETRGFVPTKGSAPICIRTGAGPVTLASIFPEKSTFVWREKFIRPLVFLVENFPEVGQGFLITFHCAQAMLILSHLGENFGAEDFFVIPRTF